jgi:hypothetical protein
VTTTGAFTYHVVAAAADDPQPVSLIAAWIATGQPLQAVLWSPPDLNWIYAPALAAQRLYDDQYQDTVRPVDRATAEQIAMTALGTSLPRDVLRTYLPSEQRLRDLCLEGKRMGWTYGPPRQ